MKLNELKLRSFRNYGETAVAFDPGVNLIVGDNAQGKTNLLEAIAYLGSGKSFRTQKTGELVRFGGEFGEIEGKVFSQDREQTLRWVLFPGSRPRQLWRNGAKQESNRDIAGLLPTVLFCPEDLMILKLGAAQRRRFGDSALCGLRPNYDAALTEYSRILDQKSRILKDHFDHPGVLEILPEYNTRLCQVGALLISYRARFYDSLGKAAAKYHSQFSGGTEEFSLEYKTVSTVTDPFAPVSVLTQNLLDHLDSHHRAELETGQCLTGPHKADFTVTLSGIDLKACLAQNKDFVAWLSISGTVISYPVVRSDDSAYYLSHLFSGKKSKLGCLFSLKSSDYQQPSQNIAIYGHHLSHSDAMFSTLIDYKQEAYYAEHSVITLDSIYGRRNYRIFAVLNMKVSDWDPATASFGSGKAFLQFVNRAKRKALYSTDVEVKEDDHILTLITCDRSYGGASGRLIVIAVQAQKLKRRNTCS